MLQDMARYCILQATTRYCKTLQESRTVAAAIVPLVRVLNWRKPKRWGTIGQDGLMERLLLAIFSMILASCKLPLVDGYVGDSSVEEATGIHYCATHKGSGGRSWCKQQIYAGNWKVRCLLAQSPNAGIDHASRSIEVMDRLKIFQIKTLLCRIPCRTVSLVKPGTWHLSIVLKDT